MHLHQGMLKAVMLSMLGCLQTAYMGKDSMEISEVLIGVPDALQPLYREVTH